MSAAFDALASLYRRNDVETLRLVAAEAAALADLLSKRTASKLSPVATSSRSEKARKAAQARWSNAPSNAQADAQACSEQCSNDAQACSEQCSNDAPSMLQASTKHAPSIATEGDKGGGSLGISPEFSGSDPKENTQKPPVVPQPPASEPEPKRKRRTAMASADELDEFVARWKLTAARAEHGAEFAKFTDHHRAKGSVMADWAAAWRTWIANAEQWAKQRGAPPRRSGLAAQRDVPDEVFFEYGRPA